MTPVSISLSFLTRGSEKIVFKIKMRWWWLFVIFFMSMLSDTMENIGKFND